MIILLIIALVLTILASWLSAAVGITFMGEYLPYFVTDNSFLNYAFIAQLFILISIPALLIVLTLYGLVSSRSRKIKPLRRKLDWVWGINLLLLFIWVPVLIQQFAHQHQEVYSTTIERSDNELNIDVQSIQAPESRIGVHTDFIKLQNGKFYQHPSISISNEEVEDIVVERVHTARGKTDDKAKIRSNKLFYPYEVDASDLTISDYFKIQPRNRWRGQTLEYKIKIPIGQKIKLSDLSDFYEVDLDLKDYKVSPLYQTDKIWTMTTEGLVCDNCATSADS